MGNITNAEYQEWINRLKALRTKHGLSTSITAPGNVKITADKMNELLAGLSVSSKWLSSSMSDRVTKSALIYQTLADKINTQLTTWEAVCVHNTVFSANFTSHKSADFTNFSAHRANCASNFFAFDLYDISFDSDFDANGDSFFSNFNDYGDYGSDYYNDVGNFIGFMCNAFNRANFTSDFNDFDSEFEDYYSD